MIGRSAEDSGNQPPPGRRPAPGGPCGGLTPEERPPIHGYSSERAPGPWPPTARRLSILVPAVSTSLPALLLTPGGPSAGAGGRRAGPPAAGPRRRASSVLPTLDTRVVLRRGRALPRGRVGRPPWPTWTRRSVEPVRHPAVADPVTVTSSPPAWPVTAPRRGGPGLVCRSSGAETSSGPPTSLLVTHAVIPLGEDAYFVVVLRQLVVRADRRCRTAWSRSGWSAPAAAGGASRTPRRPWLGRLTSPAGRAWPARPGSACARRWRRR